MRKITYIAAVVCCVFSQKSLCQEAAALSMNPTETVEETVSSKSGFYDFNVTDIDGKVFKFSSLKGKKVMIVNTASQCGYTPQYKDLEKLYEKYKNSNFVIIGFPSNDFGAQEPGDEKQIKSFCQKNYGVTFPMMSKVTVTGSNMHPVYQFLTNKRRNGVQDSKVGWNFQKYLIGPDGKLEKVLESKVTPMDPQITNWIEKGSEPKKK